ncbi:DUF4127 family protein [Catellatospora sp. KI3]|uniref:DUF4127 family protein n=1 Tax=Catellatospora sp. KI3 TaxID=3041620 RepID=UPI0024825621|nr:DUF4127 family protein [Catellatospora sp. KI3]MDI1463456.1 DUF4127 family protein [Catellatospora sp. KI3]
MMRIVLVPLDDRPACARLPQLVAAVAGARMSLPPRPVLPDYRQPGDAASIARWLANTPADATVVSLETLGFGGLIASRIGREHARDVLGRWSVLSGRTGRTHAATVVQRTPDADDAAEEPAYWAEHGRALHAYSAQLHRALRDGTPQPDRDAVPAEARRDFLRRRHRNHLLNQHALAMAADGTVATLVIGADDTAADAVGSAEWHWLQTWARWLEPDGQVLSHPGADEIGTALTARALAQHARITPQIEVTCADPAGLARTAAYEPVPVGQGVASQITAAGGVVTTGGTGPVLVVHAPQPGGHDWAVAPPPAADRSAAEATAALVGRLITAGRTVALADCAHPNGADPALLELLCADGTLSRLAGFAGWNTAGNSIGTAVAHLVAVLAGKATGTFDSTAHQRLLAHRVAEDHCYMSHARARVRAQIGADPTRHDHIPAGTDVPARIEHAVTERWQQLDPVPGWRVRTGSVTLPWQRTFEIDLDVEKDR